MAYMSAGEFDPVLVLFIVWAIWPMAVLASLSHFIFRKNFSSAWKLSLLVATAVFAIITAAIYISIVFFSKSSTAALGVLTAPVIASVAALGSGGLVHTIFLLRRKT